MAHYSPHVFKNFLQELEADMNYESEDALLKRSDLNRHNDNYPKMFEEAILAILKPTNGILKYREQSRQILSMFGAFTTNQIELVVKDICKCKPSVNTYKNLFCAHLSFAYPSELSSKIWEKYIARMGLLQSQVFLSCYKTERMTISPKKDKNEIEAEFKEAEIIDMKRKKDAFNFWEDALKINESVMQAVNNLKKQRAEEMHITAAASQVQTPLDTAFQEYKKEYCKYDILVSMTDKKDIPPVVPSKIVIDQPKDITITGAWQVTPIEHKRLFTEFVNLKIPPIQATDSQKCQYCNNGYVELFTSTVPCEHCNKGK